MVGGMIRWDLNKLIDQIRSVCEVEESGCWIWRHNRAYPEIMIKRQRQSVARWLLEVTTGETGSVARHSCDRPSCCNPQHLLWGSQADNVEDAFRRGRRHHRKTYIPRQRKIETFARGEAHGQAKLSVNKVRAIRARHTQGESIYRLAKEYNVTKRTIQQIVRRVTWTHV